MSNKVPNRKRKHQLLIRLNDAEYKILKSQLSKTGMSQREYLINLIINKPIFEIHDLDVVENQIRKIGININQIAKKANCNDYVAASDLNLLKEEQIKIWQSLKLLKVVPHSKK